MDKTWTDAEAKLLRELRAASGQDRSNFARRSTISVAQLTELEDGGSGRFYSDRIKAHTGYTLLARLGHPGTVQAPGAPAPASAPAAPHAPEPAVTTPPVQPAVPMDRMDQPSAAATSENVAGQMPSLPAHAMGGTGRVVAIGTALVLGALLVWVSQRSPSQSGTAVSAPQPVPAANTASSSASAEVPAAQPAALASGASPPEMLRASAPAAAPVPALPASDRAPASPAASQPTAAADPRCVTSASQVAEYSPQRPSKAGNYVHLESAKDVVVCVTDGQKRQMVAAVRPGDGVTVSGEPPFTLHAPAWGEVRVFFQGVRVPVETLGSVQAVTLLPR